MYGCTMVTNNGCTKNYNVWAQPLFCSVNLLFSDVAVAVAQKPRRQRWMRTSQDQKTEALVQQITLHDSVYQGRLGIAPLPSHRWLWGGCGPQRFHHRFVTCKNRIKKTVVITVTVPECSRTSFKHIMMANSSRWAYLQIQQLMPQSGSALMDVQVLSLPR